MTMRIPRVAIAISIVLLLLPFSSPVLADGTIVIDRFNDDVAVATLDFSHSLVNSSLSVDIPPGVVLTSAEVTVEGVGVNGSPSSVLDFDNGVLGTNVWAHWNEGQGLYPPTVDPRNHRWTKITATDVKSIKWVDSVQWLTQTTGQGLPPYEWPLQLYRFAPVTSGATSIEVMWNGTGVAQLNATAFYQADLWLYDHSDDVWDRVANFASNSDVIVWLNFSFDLPSPYLATDGSIDVAVAGPHSDNMLLQVPGVLLTDYIGVKVTSVGGLQYPADIALSIDDVEMATINGNVTDPVTIGAGSGLLSNLQTVLDAYQVTPDNVTLVFDFSVGQATAGMLSVRDLVIEYTPLTNTAPEYTGPTSVVVDEDSGWTSVMNLDTAFEDDFNAGELLFDIPIIDWPGDPLALFRIGTDDGGNQTLDVIPENDFFGVLPVTVEVKATDLFGLEALAQLDMTVLQIGDPPHLQQVGSIEAHERATTTFTVNVIDVDLPDDEFTFSDDTDLLDIDPVTGEISWTPSPDQIGTHTFRVIVTDRFGYTDWVLVTIVVENSNDPPVITSNENLKAKQDEEATYLILTDDPDVAYGDVLSYFTFADVIDIDVDPSTGWMTFTPTNAQVPSFDITIRVEDLIGEKDELVLHVTVENVNDPPVFQEVGELTFDQGEHVMWTLEVEDPDMDLGPPLTDVLTYSSVGADLFSPDGRSIVFQAGQEDVGTHEVIYTVTDSGGLSDVITITWVIRDVNDAPVIVNQLPDVLNEDEEFNLTMSAIDADGNKVTWADDTDMFDIDPDTGVIDFTPAQKDVGTHQVTLTASDGWGGKGTATFNFEVRNVNDGPTIGTVLPSSGSTFDEGDTIELTAQATDEDGDQLTYVWTWNGKELGRGVVVETDDLPAGTSKVVLTVTDGNGGLATYEFEVEVQSISGGLLLPIAIAAILAVIVVVFLLARNRGMVRKGSVEETAKDVSEEGSAPSSDAEVVLDYDTESVTVVDAVPVEDIELDFGDGPLEDVTEVPPALEEAPIFHLEETDEYRPDRKDGEGTLPEDDRADEPDS